MATDYNGDGMADEMFYDLNGDGVFTPNEGATLNGAEQFSMSNLGQASQTTVYVQGNEGGSEEGHGTNGEGGNNGGTEGEDSQFTVDQTTAIVDAEGNLLASQTAGTMDGKVYVVTDYDGDGMADELYYDVNGDGEFTPDEGGVIEGDDQFAMSDLGKATNTTVYVQGNEGGNGEEPLPGEDEELPDDTDIDDIHNDEDGQLNEGNEGEGDYADNNDDFQLLGCYGCESVDLYFQWTCHLELSQSQAFAATHDELIYKWRVDVCHQHGFVGHFVAVVQT